MDGDFVVFYRHGCWRWQRRTKTRVKELAKSLLCFDCSLTVDRSSARPSGLGKAEVRYEYRCRLCQRLSSGKWPADDLDAERKLRARLERERCLACFSPTKSSPKSTRAPRHQAVTATGATCVHGIPVGHCAYCNPGRYAYRPWRKSNL
jgi:hypothetical protein